MKLSRLALPMRVTLLYLLFGGFWILLSDQILSRLLLQDPQQTVYQTLKGWFFIFVSGILLYFLLRKDFEGRQQAERITQLANARWQEIVRGIADEVWTCDAQGKMSLLNLEIVSAMKLEAFKDKSVEDVYQEVEIFYPDGQPRPPEQAPLLRSLRGEIVRGEEIMQHRQTGITRYRQFSSAPTRDAQGGITGAVAIVRDVTEVKQVEEALRKSEERFVKAFRASPEALTISQMSDGSIIEVNAGWKTLFGYEETEVLGKTSLELNLFVNPEDRKQAVHLLQERGSLRDFELEIRCKSGEVRQAVLSSESIEINGIACLLSILRDITDRKRAEEALRQSEKRFRALVEASSEVIYRMSPDWTEMYQLVSRDFIANTEEPTDTWLQKYIHPDDQPQVMAVINEAIRTRSVFQLEHRVLRVDGSLGWTLSRAVPLLGANGEITDWYGMASDITERKQAEENLHRFELLSNHSRDIILFMGRDDGRLLEVNAAAIRAYGYNREELLALTIRDLRAPNTLGLTAEQMAQADAGGILFETVHLRKDGTTFPVEVSSRGATIGGVRTLVSVVRDITERKQAEEEILNLSKFPAENPYPVLRVQNDGRVTYANAASRELLEVWGCEINGTLPEELRNLISVIIDHASNRTMDAVCNDKVYSLTLVPIAEGGYVNLYGSDISERKRAEAALRESEQKFSLLFSRSGVPTILVRLPESRFVDVNQAFERVFGYPAAETIGRTTLELGFIRPAERTPAIVDLERTGQLRDRELRLFTRSGEPRSVMVQTSPIEIDGVPHTLTTLHDITERKQVEEKIRRSEAMLRAVLDQMPSGVTVRDAQTGSLILSNARSKEIMGTLVGSADQFAQYRGFHSDGRPYQTEEWPLSRSMIRGEIVRSEEVSYQQSDGTQITLSINSAPVRDQQGEIVMAVSVFDDITGRKKAEEQLRYQAAVLANVNDAIIASDAQFRLTAWNSAAESLYGWKAEKVIGRNGLEIVRTEWPEKDADEMRRTIAETGRWRGEATQIRSDGTRIPVEVSSIVLRDASGKITDYISVNRDITERKRAEEELHRLLEELKYSNAELEQFAYIASHDLQEPLRMVSSYVQLLARRYQGKLDSDADEFIAFAVDGAKRMQNLINDLLAYSRVGTRGRALVSSSCDEALKDALANLQFAIEESRATITYEPLPDVNGDPTQLVQLFQNLLSNAIKFRGPGPSRIQVEVQQEGAEWVFRVRDNGIGLDPKFAERIFVIFQRLHQRDAYPGTGIGLAICKRIVQRHGGRIWVESQPGEGATFYFTLPIQENT